MRLPWQVFHKLTNPTLYGIVPESPEHLYALEEVRKEVAALLSPLCDHPNIVRLHGVVVDDRGRPIKLLFECADLGDLDGCVGSTTSCKVYFRIGFSTAT